MREFEMRQISSIREILMRMKCDICGKESERDDWDRGYNVDRIQISRTVGSKYPEGGSGTETFFDICPECFENKLIPWLKLQGAVPQSKDWDY